MAVELILAEDITIEKRGNTILIIAVAVVPVPQHLHGIHRQATLHHRQNVLLIHLKDAPKERNRQIHIHQQQVTLLQEDFPLQTRRKSRRRKRNHP